jgi:hypothetical protein
MIRVHSRLLLLVNAMQTQGVFDSMTAMRVLKTFTIRLTVVVAMLLLAANAITQAQAAGAKPATASKSGYMFLDFWFLAGYDYNPNEPFEPSPKQVKNTIPANILALNGKKVEIYGNILPLDYDTSGTSTFILNASVDACGFGGVPRINEWVYVTMKPGQKAKTYGAGYEILVRGTFSIAEEVEKGRIVGLYSIVADSVQ